MAKDKPNEATPPATGTEASETPKDMVVFGRQTIDNIPEHIQRALAPYKTKEVHGFAESWKPKGPGDAIAGVLAKLRSEVGQFKSSLVILDTDKGPKSVWLGADLKMKITADMIGSPVVIVYQGMAEPRAGKQPQKMYTVISVIEPIERLAPAVGTGTAKQLSS